MKLAAYGLFGMPLALAALPVYVYVPALYAEQFSLSLSVLGAVLLAARLADAFLDPLLGAWTDRRGFARAVALGAPLLGLGFAALLLPPAGVAGHALAWLAGALTLTYLGYSLATIAHQGWGAALTQAPGERARLVAVREGCALGGVLLGSALLQAGDARWLVAACLLLLAIGGGLLLGRAPRAPQAADAPPLRLADLWLPFGTPAFRWLFAVFLANGIAAAIPATLFFFYARDALALGDAAGACLLLYFLAAALSLPLWTRAARRFGEARAWLAGMLLAVAAFIGAWWLESGALAGFATICLLSGLALGADLTLPAALLAGVIARAGHSGRAEGAYFGAWQWASKLNLALAAGLALPLLELLGYAPGQPQAEGEAALRFAYALLPCALKLGAAALLARAPLRDV